MAQKQLRSLIHEYFSDESCRWDLIELSYRSAGITDMSVKQDELFDICRKFGINASPLGEGTNRFGFKIGSYCFKFAINREGRVNNKNELRKCKALYPYVTRAHECTGDGTILVCEYVRAFQSFGEMEQYRDEILEDLRVMNRVFIIGDVGITSKNYGNWGLRGTKAVCLDSGAAHLASSAIYRCGTCGTFVMPTQSYDKLQCPNCQRMYRFEEIERRISENDFDDDIGDLESVAYQIHHERETVTLDKRSPLSQEISKKMPILTLDSQFNVKRERPLFSDLDKEYFDLIGV
jgi:predicted RNA-binding Zn-ribbon protein involved in translation (DUF1610 family)